MLIYRYMSRDEFFKLMKGEDLINTSDHSNARTESVGFCFLPDTVKIKKNVYYTPSQSYSFLSGLVTPDVLVEFEIDKQVHFKTGRATYADPTPRSRENDTIIIKEFSMPSYNKNLVRPKRYATACLFQGNETPTLYGEIWDSTHATPVWKDPSEYEKDPDLASEIMQSNGTLRQQFREDFYHPTEETLYKYLEIVKKESHSSAEFRRYIVAILLCMQGHTSHKVWYKYGNSKTFKNTLTQNIQMLGFSPSSTECRDIELEFYSFVLDPKNNMYDVNSPKGISEMFKYFEKAPSNSVYSNSTYMGNKYMQNILNLHNLVKSSKVYETLDIRGYEIQLFKTKNEKSVPKNADEIMQEIKDVYSKIHFIALPVNEQEFEQDIEPHNNDLQVERPSTQTSTTDEKLPIAQNFLENARNISETRVASNIQTTSVEIKKNIQLEQENTQEAPNLDE